MLGFFSIFSKSEKLSLFWLTAIILTMGFVELIGLFIVIPYVNLMMDNAPVTSGFDGYFLINEIYSRIIELDKLTVSVLFAFIYIVKNILLMILFFLQQDIVKNIKYNITDRAFMHYMQKPYSFHLSQNSSKTIRSVTYDVNNFIGGVLKKGSILALELIILTGIVGVMIWTDPAILLLLLLLLLPLVLIYWLTNSWLKSWGKDIQYYESNIILNLQEGINGVKNIILSNSQFFFINRFRKNIKEQVRIKRNLDMSLTIPRYLIEALIMIVFSFVLYWITKTGGLKENLAFVTFVAISFARMLPMSSRILSTISGIKSSMPSFEVIKDIASPIVTNYKNDITKLEYFLDHFRYLKVDKVSFKHSNSLGILNDISFKIYRGESIGIVGTSGSGKTTLVDLLLGLHLPLKGNIYFNNININRSLEDWRSKIGYVAQDVFLLDGTIKENVAFGIPVNEIDLNKVEEVIREARLENWVSELKDGLDSTVGERGVRISGGQRQRIGIARALYKDPEILILDEATSALDNNTEEHIINDIYRFKKDRTIIIIAHRLNTIKKCDKVLVLSKGRLVGNDTFDNLSRHNKTFQEVSLIKDVNNV